MTNRSSLERARRCAARRSGGGTGSAKLDSMSKTDMDRSRAAANSIANWIRPSAARPPPLRQRLCRRERTRAVVRLLVPRKAAPRRTSCPELRWEVADGLPKEELKSRDRIRNYLVEILGIG